MPNIWLTGKLNIKYLAEYFYTLKLLKSLNFKEILHNMCHRYLHFDKQILFTNKLYTKKTALSYYLTRGKFKKCVLLLKFNIAYLLLIKSKENFEGIGKKITIIYSLFDEKGLE